MPGRVLGPKDVSSIIEPIISNIKKVSKAGCTKQIQNDVRVGICVSGGPDSMALAYLMSTLPVMKGMQIVPLAMIIDHHVRPESTDEARGVQAELRRLGIASKVLDMSWPENSRPLLWSNFESEAREKRYQMIALNALQSHIQHIFTGHHLDDQVETGIMRLAYQHHDSLLGLRGILASSSIPCCDDIQGVHEEQEKASLVNSDSTDLTSTTKHDQFDLHVPNKRGRCFFPPGGISLHRPLLVFRKEDLVATCIAHNIKFVSDATNDDPTFTRRNAVRTLRLRHHLPQALQEQRITRLQSRAETWVEHVSLAGIQSLRSCLIHKLDLRSGVMEVELPELTQSDVSQSTVWSNALARLIGIVAPVARSDIPLQIPKHLLGQIIPLSTGVTSRVETPSSIIFRHTMFTCNTEKNTWTICRQPMRRKEVLRNSWQFPAIEKCQSHISDKKLYQTSWKLWDNRFWIRLSCNDIDALQNITVCPLTTDPLNRLYTRLHKDGTAEAQSGLAKLRSVLKSAAPGKVRYALPVLAINDDIISFPTLNLSAEDLGISRTIPVTCEVRYKTVKDIGQLRMVSQNSTQTGMLRDTAHISSLLGLDIW